MPWPKVCLQDSCQDRNIPKGGVTPCLEMCGWNYFVWSLYHGKDHLFVLMYLETLNNNNNKLGADNSIHWDSLQSV